MKILFPIGAFYPSQVGGPCNTVYWHTCALTHRSFSVKVVTTTLGIGEGAVKVNDSLKTRCGEVYYGQGGSSNPSTIAEAIKGSRKADVVHLNSLFDPLSIATFLYCKVFRSQAKFVWSVRGELNVEALKFSRLKKKPLLQLYKSFSKNITFHSTSEQETLDIKTHFANAKVIQIPNLIDPASRLVSPKKKQILFMGRIHPIKGLHKLIEGLALSDSFRKENYRMIFIGNYKGRQEGYHAHLMTLIQKHALQEQVEFRGHVDGHEKQKLYAESYVLVLPSESENFGNVVVESLNQGTPVIASKGTPWSILETARCGLHVENSPQGLSRALDTFLEMNPVDYNEFVDNSKLLVDKEYDINSRFQQWVTVYNNLK